MTTLEEIAKEYAVIEHGPEWAESYCELADLAYLRPDWDGEGADPVPDSLIKATGRWLAALQASGHPPPLAVTATAGGHPWVEWHGPGRLIISAAVRSEAFADVLTYQPEKHKFETVPIPP